MRAWAVSWGAVRAIAASQHRQHWRRLAVTGLAVGAAGAVVFGAAAVSQRTATAYERLIDATRFEDLNSIGLDEPAADRIRELPGVSSVRRAPAFVGQLDVPGQVYLSVTTLPDDPRALGRPLVIDGRDLDPLRTDEVLVAEPLAAQLGLRAGDRIGLTLLSREEYTQFDVGFGEPDGAALTLTIVGIARYPIWGAASPGLLVSDRLGEEVAINSIGTQTLVEFRAGSDRQSVANQIEHIAAQVESEPEFAPTTALQPEDPVPAVAVGRRVTVAALIAFVSVAAGAALIVAGQSAGRQIGAGRADQQVEHALGVRRLEQALARGALYLPAAALSGMVAAAGALAAGAIEPIGALGGYEPSPGWRANWPIVGWALAATFAVLPTAAVLLAVALAGQRRLPRPTKRLLASGLARGPVGLVAAASAGGAGRRSPRPAADLLILATVIAALTAVGVVHASSAQAERQPQQWGWRADFAVEDVRPEQVAALRADPRVTALQIMRSGTVSVLRSDGRPWALPTFGAGELKGESPLPLLRGRLPASDDELAVGPAVARALDLDLGAIVRIRLTDGTARPVVVVGVVAVPPLYNGPLGEALVGTPKLIDSASAGMTGSTALVQAEPGAGRELLEDWRAMAEVLEPYRPAAVSAMAELGALPWLVEGLFAFVAIVALARHGSATSRERLRRQDILRAIGLRPRQIALSELASVGMLAARTAVIGVPVGIALGRLLWFEIAGALGLPVEFDGALPTAALVVVGLIGASAAVALPAAAASMRRRGSSELRAE